MTPVALLAAFCATMAAVAVGRLAADETRDPVDIAAAVIVVGITILTVLWTAFEETWLTPGERLFLGIVGTGVICAGVVVMVRYWNDPPEPNTP